VKRPTHRAPEPPSDLVRVLRDAQDVLLLGHVHPDADVLGTLLALGQALEARGARVTFAGPHPVPRVLDFLPGAERWQVWQQAPRTWPVVVLTDCPNDARTEGLLAQSRDPMGEVLNIDHHPDNRLYGTLDWIDAGAAATGEMVFDLLQALAWPVTPAIAVNLFTAIHTDTGSFRYSNTTARTFRAAGALLALGADPALVSDRLYQRRPKDALLTLGEVLRRVEVSPDGQVAWLAVPRDVASEDFLAAEDLVAYPRSIDGVEVALVLREDAPGVIKASLRGKGAVPVNAIARQFGGGGHANAAGCSIRGSLDEATQALLAAVGQALGDASRP
jgi:phosphoesterase RecJ-like protein